MRDGKLEISFEAGGIRGVSVNAGLDRTYQGLFDTARQELRRPDPPIEAGIRLIVFGCFWCEAVCNEVLRELLHACTKTEVVASAVWKTIRRTPFRSKFSIVAAFAKSPDLERARRVLSDLERVFELRNRLAHFKDEYTPVAGPLTLDELQSLILNFPDADLIKKLRPSSTEVDAEAIVTGINWLNEIFQEYFPRKSHDLEEAKPEND